VVRIWAKPMVAPRTSWATLKRKFPEAKRQEVAGVENKGGVTSEGDGDEGEGGGCAHGADIPQRQDHDQGDDEEGRVFCEKHAHPLRGRRA